MGKANEWITKCEKHQFKEGCNRKNAECVGMLNEILAMNGRNSAMLYFCINNLGTKDVETMFLSTIKQKKLYVLLKGMLKSYLLDDEWYPKIKRDIEFMYNRQNHIWLITKENIRLTEYCPYFEEVGYEKLLDFSTKKFDVEGQLGYIVDDFNEWKKHNQEKIDYHMESILEEKTAMEEFRKRNEAERLSEKEARKMIRKNATKEEKEIRDNEKKHLARERKIEKSFERYYNGKY